MTTQPKARDGTSVNGDRAKIRNEGLKANYGGATPKEVARAFYWNRRKPQHPQPTREADEHRQSVGA